MTIASEQCPGKKGLTQAPEQLWCDEAVALSSCPSCVCPALALGLEAEVNHSPLTGLGGRAPQQLLPNYPGLPETEELEASLSPG